MAQWCTYFSFRPSGPFFEVTAIVASSKLQEEAAWAVPAVRSRRDERNDKESRILSCWGGIGSSEILRELEQSPKEHF